MFKFALSLTASTPNRTVIASTTGCESGDYSKIATSLGDYSGPLVRTKNHNWTV